MVKRPVDGPNAVEVDLLVEVPHEESDGPEEYTRQLLLNVSKVLRIRNNTNQ